MLLVGYFVVLLLVAVVAIPALVTTVHALNREQHRSDPTAVATNAMLTGALDQETGVRGYVITADPSFLEPFTTGTDQVTKAMATLHGPDVEADMGPAVDAMDAAFRQWHTNFADVVVADVARGQHQGRELGRPVGEGQAALRRVPRQARRVGERGRAAARGEPRAVAARRRAFPRRPGRCARGRPRDRDRAVVLVARLGSA